jgi:tetratricopeptide (TPR) repeat protein
MRFLCHSAVLFLAIVAARVVDAAPPTADEMARAIADLGASDFSRREAASDLLWRAGKAAQGLLRQALQSTDPETRVRAREVLKKLRWGVSPETPGETLSLIDGFQAAQVGYDRREIVRKLAAQKAWRLIFELLRTLPNAEDRRILLSTLTKDIQVSITELIQQEKWVEAEAALEVLVASEFSTIPQLLSFLVVTDRLDAAIDDWKSRIAEDNGRGRREDWIRLTYLLRAKGDVPAMLAAAEHTTDLILWMYLYAEAGEWRESARFAEEIYQVRFDHLETASWAATCYRLAGDAAGSERMLTIIADKARADVEKAEQSAENRVLLKDLRIAAKALIVNERIDEGLAILRRIDPTFVHRLYSVQHRHQQALDLANVHPGRELDRKWFDELPAPLPLEPPAADYRVNLAAQVARHLSELGLKDQAVQIWKLLRDLDTASADGAKRLSFLALLAWQLGRDGDATRTAAEAMAAGATPAALLSSLAGRQGTMARAWYERILAANPKNDRAAALAESIRMVLPTPRHGQPPTNWLQTMEAARASLGKLSPAAKASRLVLFGNTAQIRGDEGLARELFFEAATTDAKYGQPAGEIEALSSKWDKAAEHFAAAAKANPSNRVAKYLWADALRRAGDPELSAVQMRQVDLEVLAPDARYNLVKALVQRWLKDELLRQHEIVCRTALPISWHFANCSRERGNLLSAEKPEQAIGAWMQQLLYVLSPTSNFTEPEGYTSLIHLVHKTRARAAIDAGDADAAKRELEACERILPGDARLALEVLPRLRAAEMSALFGELFENTFATQMKMCSDFPQSATNLNLAAWLCARSQQRLDAALELVQRAIALDPGVAAYRDTLAEVHFQRGDREAAVAAARRCLELTGPTKQSATRLRHFTESELRTFDGSR